MGLRRFALLFATIASATPQISLPINAQVPQIAFANQPYEFQFSASTFLSDDGGFLEYELQDGPQWLQLDGATRTFSGMPITSDVESLQFKLVARDQTGAADMEVTLLVDDGPPLQVASDLTQQLEQSAVLLDTNSVALYTGADFSIPFAPDTFTGAQGLYYYATSGDRSPLPSWVTFNAVALVFSGTAPSKIALPQTFELCLFASRTPNFAETSVCFSLVVNEHQLAFTPFEQNVSVSRGAPVSVTMLRSQLYLDGKHVTGDDIVGADASVPDWLEFNATDLALTGQPPASASFQQVKVRASDRYGDNAHALINFVFAAMLFEGEIGVLAATIGTFFSYTVKSNLFAVQVTDVQILLGPGLSWLTFEASNMTLQGVVPSDAPTSTYNLSIRATSVSNSATENQTFQLMVVDGSAGTNTSATAVLGETSTSSRKAEIAAAVLGSVLGAAIVGVALWFLVMRRRRIEQVEPKGFRDGPDKPFISAPLEKALERPKTPVVSRRSSLEAALAPPPAPPLKHRRPPSSRDRPTIKHVHPDSSMDITSRNNQEGELNDVELSNEESDVITSTLRSSFPRTMTPTASRLASFQTLDNRQSAEYARARELRQLRLGRRRRMSRMSSGMPYNSRLSGFGHGRFLEHYGTPGSSFSRIGTREMMSDASPAKNSGYAFQRNSESGFSVDSRRLSRDREKWRSKHSDIQSSKDASLDDKRRTYIDAWYDAMRPESLKPKRMPMFQRVEEEESDRSMGDVMGDTPGAQGDEATDMTLKERRQMWVKTRASNATLNRPLFLARDDESRKSSTGRSARWRQRSSGSYRRVSRPLFRTRSNGSPDEIVTSTPLQYPRVVAESTRDSVNSAWEDMNSPERGTAVEIERRQGQLVDVRSSSPWEDVSDSESQTDAGLQEEMFNEPFEFGPLAAPRAETIGLAVGTPTIPERTIEDDLRDVLQARSYEHFSQALKVDSDDEDTDDEERRRSQFRFPDGGAFV